MNKYAWFMLTMIYLVIVTLVITATSDATGYAVGSGVPDALQDMEDGLSFSTAWAFVRIYFNILFFNITDFPATLSLIIFHPVALANGLLFLDIVKDLIPFT